MAVFVHGHSKASKSYPFLRQPHKQVALQPAEGNMRFNPQLLCMFASQNSSADGAAMRLQNHTWSAWMTQVQPFLHLFMHRVVGVLTSPLHVPLWAPTKYLLSRNILSAAVSSWQRTSVSLVTHTHRNTVYHPDPDISLFIITLTERQNMIYMKLQTVRLPSTVTSTRSHVAKGLADDLIKKYGGGESSVLQFFSKVSYRYKTEWHVRSVSSKLLGRAVWHGPARCEMVLCSVTWSRAMWNCLAQCEMIPRSWTFLLKTLLEPSVFLVVLNLYDSNNKIKRMRFFSFHCEHSYYAYYKKLSKCRAVVRSCRTFRWEQFAGRVDCSAESSGRSCRMCCWEQWQVRAAVKKTGGNVGCVI